MKTRIKNYIPHQFVLSIPAIPGMKQAINIIKKLLKSLRFFFPPEREFYYPKEQAAYKNAMEIKKNNFPGQGPPR